LLCLMRGVGETRKSGRSSKVITKNMYDAICNETEEVVKVLEAVERCPCMNVRTKRSSSDRACLLIRGLPSTFHVWGKIGPNPYKQALKDIFRK